MKAGNAGSNPDGLTIDKETTTNALSIFLREIGNSVFFLNTIVVGLDAVEKGHEKPESLDISWQPHDTLIAARQARKFAVESTIVHTAEAINQYIYTITKLSRFSDIRNKWSESNKDFSKADKLKYLYKYIFYQDNDYHLQATMLLMHWRNRIVHSNSSSKLTTQDEKDLKNSENHIFQKYKNLNIIETFSHFELGRPTLKDVSSLVAMTINLIRKIDKEIYASFTKQDLQIWLEHYGINSHLEKIKKESSPIKLQDSIKRLFKSKAPNLLHIYLKFSDE